MGITIHYKGKINKAENMGKMTAELTDISTELNWKHHLINDAIQEVKGIVIKPHANCESLAILLNKDHHLISFFALGFDEANEKSARFVSIKTQFAPIQIHISIIKLLSYLKGKYISNLEVIDEGDYWETKNEAVLKEKMAFVAMKIDLFGEVLASPNVGIGEAGTTEELADKIEEIFRRLTSKK